MRNRVEHRLVALVADADEDLQRVLGHGKRHVAIVEPGEVGARTTAAHDAQHVEVRGVLRKPAQASEQARLQFVALHLDRHQGHCKAKLRLLELAQEVVPTIRVGTRQHADAQRGHDESKTTIAQSEALLGQFAQDLFARERQLAEREARIDVLHDDLEAARSDVEVDLHEHAHFDSIAQRERVVATARATAELVLQPLRRAAKQRHLDDGERARLVLGLLDELEEAMLAAGALVVVDDFACDPERVRKLAAQAVANERVELRDRERRAARGVFCRAGRCETEFALANGCLRRRCGRRAEGAGEQRRNLGREVEQVPAER